MKRREFCKGIALVPASGALLSTTQLAEAATAASTETSSSGAAQAEAGAQTGKAVVSSGKRGLPGYAGNILYSDAANASLTGALKTDPKSPYQMPLTDEEQAIMNGSKGEELAKVMTIVVAHGNTFGADKLVELGGAPHSSLFIGTDYMSSMLKMFDECAKAGLKSYKPYTVNPRPYDLFNVNNNAQDMQMIYEGYGQQRELEYVHVRLGSPDFNYRSCACYLDEIGNAPKPGTYVAWAESSAVNYGNSVLGLRTNRNATGMELLCALLGKAPRFGLMTDEGRMSQWLVEIKTSGEPDWGVIGTAIGLKVVADTPYITGLDKYFKGGKVTAENLHQLKAMGSATASAGAVGLYHVDGVTPDANEKGRDLLVKGYQTYVIDDAEQERVRGTFPNLWKDKNAKPTACFIGCPHNTYQELYDWGRWVTEALDKLGKKEAAMPVYLFCPLVVRDRLVVEQPELVGKMKQAGMKFTNMCGVSYAGMKGFSDRVNGVTNSAKTRAYSNLRYFPNDELVQIVVTGEMPKGA